MDRHGTCPRRTGDGGKGPPEHVLLARDLRGAPSLSRHASLVDGEARLGDLDEGPRDIDLALPFREGLGKLPQACHLRVVPKGGWGPRG